MKLTKVQKVQAVQALGTACQILQEVAVKVRRFHKLAFKNAFLMTGEPYSATVLTNGVIILRPSKRPVTRRRKK